MKKTLSLILAVMMLLGCMSITVFAKAHEPGVGIAGTMLTADGIVSNTAITSGTVTYTAASDGNPAKLILNNAVISGPCDAPIISVYDINLVIELIGNNQVTAGSDAAVLSMNTELTITGSGSLIIHGNGGEGSVAIVVKGTGGITLSEGCKMVGSTSKTETVIDTMSEVTFDADEKTYMVGEAVAQTVAIYNSNAASGKSGNTDITLTVAKSLTYDMVIPEDVTNLNAAGIYSVGQAKVTNVKNATDKTVISYTAETTAFKCEGKTDIPASYYTDEAGQNAFPTTAVEVYKAKSDAASIPNMWVKIAEDAWNAAENGTYNATVTFNFAAEEKEPECEVDLNTYTQLYKVVKIDDAKVYIATYTYESGSFAQAGYSLIDLPKTNFESGFGTTYAVGDCYHIDIDGQTFEKCALPESHGLSSNEIVFTYKNAVNVQAPVIPYAVPEGTTYEIRDNQLYISCTDSPVSIAGNDYTFTLNGTSLSNGATDTISDGDAFVGTKKVTIADILPEGFPTSEMSNWVNGCACHLFVSGDNLCAKGGAETSVPVATVLTPTSGDYDYTYTVSGITWNFSVEENEFWRVNISGFTGGDEELNGTYGIPR